MPANRRHRRLRLRLGLGLGLRLGLGLGIGTDRPRFCFLLSGCDPSHEYIVDRVRADGDPEAAQDEDPGEEDAGHPAKDEGEPGERLAGAFPRGERVRRAAPIR